MILGVSKWLSEKLGWDVTFIRIAFVVAGLIFWQRHRPIYNPLAGEGFIQVIARITTFLIVVRYDREKISSQS
ncbi:MAG: PspC domain-containing protein [Vicingaceae bacterium]